MLKDKNSAEKPPVSAGAKTALKVGLETPHPKSTEIRDTLLTMGVQLDDLHIEVLAKQTAAKVKQRVERARKKEEEKAWKDELSPNCLVVALSEMLLSGKRRGPKPKGSTDEASTTGVTPPASSPSSEAPATSQPPAEAKLSLDEFKLAEGSE